MATHPFLRLSGIPVVRSDPRAVGSPFAAQSFAAADVRVHAFLWPDHPTKDIGSRCGVYFSLGELVEVTTEELDDEHPPRVCKDCKRYIEP
jgi:hypothetical protein